MRLMIFWSHFQHYHVARIRAAIEAGREAGHEVSALALRASSAALPVGGYHHLLGADARVLMQDGDPTSGLRDRLSQALTAADPDVVAIPGYDDCAALTALDWCQSHRRGALLMSESQRRDFRRSAWREAIKRRIVANYDAALVGGNPHLAYAQELGFASEAVFQGYDAVDNRFWADSARCVRADAPRQRGALGLPARYFLTACRLVPKKNVGGLLRAYAAYASRTPAPWSLVIAGDGPLRGALESEAASLGLTESVQFRGYLDADGLAPVYALASAFVLASAYSEQWGLVVNEAMAAGLPVLVSEVCGCAPDLVEDGVTGFRFDPANTEQLGALLARVAGGELDLAKMGRQAQARVELCSPEVFAQSLWASAAAAQRHAAGRSRSFAGERLVDFVSQAACR